MIDDHTTAEREPRLGNLVGHAPDRGAEVVRLRQVGGSIIAAADVGPVAVAIGYEQAPAQGDGASAGAVRVGERNRLDL